MDFAALPSILTKKIIWLQSDIFSTSSKHTADGFKSNYPGIAMFLYSLDKHAQGVAYYEMASEKDLKGEDFYNMAFGYLKLGQTDEAFGSLHKAIEINSQLRQRLESDRDFEMLRADPRYRSLTNKTH